MGPPLADAGGPWPAAVVGCCADPDPPPGRWTGPTTAAAAPGADAVVVAAVAAAAAQELLLLGPAPNISAATFLTMRTIRASSLRSACSSKDPSILCRCLCLDVDAWVCSTAFAPHPSNLVFTSSHMQIAPA